MRCSQVQEASEEDCKTKPWGTPEQESSSQDPVDHNETTETPRRVESNWGVREGWGEGRLTTTSAIQSAWGLCPFPILGSQWLAAPVFPPGTHTPLHLQFPLREFPQTSIHLSCLSLLRSLQRLCLPLLAREKSQKSGQQLRVPKSCSSLSQPCA